MAGRWSCSFISMKHLWGMGMVCYASYRPVYVGYNFFYTYLPQLFSPECRLECSLDYGGHVYVATLITLVNSAYS